MADFSIPMFIAQLIVAFCVGFAINDMINRTTIEDIELQLSLKQTEIDVFRNIADRAMNQTQWCATELKDTVNLTGQCVQKLQLCRGY